jgi:hypothetical protein
LTLQFDVLVMVGRIRLSGRWLDERHHGERGSGEQSLTSHNGLLFDEADIARGKLNGA